MDKPTWETLEKLSKLEEMDRRSVLRPHDEAGLSSAVQKDKDAMAIRGALDKELTQLALTELDQETGGSPDLAFLDEYKALLLKSRAFSQYLNSYLYFGVRFLLGRKYCYCEGPDEEGDGPGPGEEGGKKHRQRIWNERTVPLKPPDAVEGRDGQQALADFQRLLVCDGSKWGDALGFLDGFTSMLRGIEDEDGSAKEGTQKTFELYLRGLLPPNDRTQDQNLSALRLNLIGWAEGRCKFYRDLEPPPETPKNSVDEKTARKGPPPKQWRRNTSATNPLAARFGTMDLYWLARILGASVSSQCQVSYVGVSWLELISRQGEAGQAGQFTYLEMEEILRNVFDFACELVQNSIEISEQCEWRKAHPEDKPETPTDSWRLTYDRELNEIHGQRKLREYQRPPDPSRPQPKAETAKTPCGEDDVQEYYWSRRVRTGETEQDLVGLAISGGGIRSATFGLGVLERLREIDLLRRVDYLSTVSGGGYIGAWLLGNVRRTRYWLGKPTSWKESIDHLRDYSDYLAPHSGLFSADTWVMWGTWIRNALLIQLLALVCLGTVLTLGLLGKKLFDLPGRDAGTDFAAQLLLAGCTVGIAVFVCWQLSSVGSAKGQKGPKIVAFFAWVASFVTAALLWRLASDLTPERGLMDFSAFLPLFWRTMPGYMGVCFYASYAAMSAISLWPEPGKGWTVTRVAGALLTPLPCMGVAYISLCGVLWFFNRLAAEGIPQGSWMSYVLGPPLTLMAFTLAVVMFIGVIGKSTADWRREWWTRYGSWLGIFGAIFLASGLAAVFGPQWTIELSKIIPPALTWSGGASFVATVVGALFAGKSSRTKGDAANGSGAAMQWLARIGALLFIVAGVLAMATSLHQILALNLDHSYQDYWFNLNEISKENLLWVVLGILVATGLLFGSRFDLNIFGLNQFYRNRLVRCYLGATRWRPGLRRPNGFTGFDEGDDLLLTDLRFDCEKWDKENFRGPFPLINCALNLGGSSDLQVKTRQSASFTLTPLTRGVDRPKLGYLLHPGPDAVTLGQAISISGAAASPNMGYNTSPLVSFLLTVFNVRLGWWFPNPGRRDQPAEWSRRFNFSYLFQELFGLADESSALVNLSDGGHFENLGIYELVRRRAKVIIACDAEADPDLTFGSLGNLIRICKTDFGAEIDLDVGSIRKGKESGLSRAHCAVGKINYASGRQGYLIYLKSSVTGDENVGVEQYQAGHPTFPHETTADQFFSEDQFEAYRRLGHHAAEMTFRGWKMREIQRTSPRRSMTFGRRRVRPPSRW